MTWLISFLISTFGLAIFAFTVGNVILIMFFAIPFTKKLEKHSLIKPNMMIIQSYSISLLIQIGIIVAVTTLFIFMPTKNYLISLFVGYILGIVGIIQKASSFGVNIDNFTEYFEKNRDCFWPQLVTKYAENKQELFQYILQSINSSR